MSAIAGVGDFGLQAIANETKAYRDETLGFVNGRFPQSLTVFVDGTNGSDTRTGLTDDTNATTGRVKTIDRVAQLYSNRVSTLNIVIFGTLNITTPTVSLTAGTILIFIQSGAIVNFKSKSLSDGSTVVGQGTCRIDLLCNMAHIEVNGTINVEGHTGSTGAGAQYYYRSGQGAIALVRSGSEIDAQAYTSLNITGTGNINIGNNCYFALASRAGLNGDFFNAKAKYTRSSILPPTVTLGTNAVESGFQGDRTLIRTYTPISSTDANVTEGEICADSNFLYRKSSGTIKKIAWTAF